MRFRLMMIAVCLLLAHGFSYASPCSLLKSQPDSWVATKVNALVKAAHRAYEREEAAGSYERVLGRIAATLRQCRLGEDESFVGRYREFVEYVEAASYALKPDHQLGFTVPDRQYFAETRPFVQIPEFLLTQSFLQVVSRFETLDRAKSFLRQLNSTREPEDQLIFFSYKSRHLGTPDNNSSFNRLLIVVPGNAAKGIPEKWVQFGITDPGGRVLVRNVSIVSALRGPDGTANIYFKDYYRTYRRDGSISIKGRWELGYGAGNCVRCHKSGILPIFPAEGSVSGSEQPQVQIVNQRFLTYGTPRFEEYMDERKFGPGLASAKWQERNQRFGSGFDGTIVAHAMTCAACHRPERLGALNWPMDRIVIGSFIKGGQMPLGFSLPDSQRDDLYEKLIQEYFATDDDHPGVLKSWLLGKLR